MTLPLFDDPPAAPTVEPLGPEAFVLRGFARAAAPELLAALAAIEAAAPFRQMVTPGGFTMSVALTNCGRYGWTSDRSGYRYTERDPLTGAPWPAMPPSFAELAQRAAAAAGFASFEPDACLVNRYVPEARLSLHQDKDERRYDAPIVSVSLGIPAVFLFGGLARSQPPARVPLRHGDVVVWGGVDRLRYHGVLPVKPAEHPLLGARRINFTLRRAGE
jgi:alkylated DNA repair protein (DNA oxidative demethylase)